MIPFTGYMPDADPTTPGVITELASMVPTIRGSYVGAPTGVDVGMSALASAALGAAILTKLDGSSRLFAGTAAALYEKSGTTWNDVSRATAYGASTTHPWRFAQFGNTSLAINKVDQLQSISAGTDFADVAAPSAAVMCVSNRFVMLGNTNNGGSGTTFGDSPDRWYCSAIEDETNWTLSITTQCVSGRLVDTPGPITGMRTLGESIVVYKAGSMYLATYEGPPAVWRFDLVSAEVGCASHEAIVELDNAHFFIGQDDFYRFTLGGLPVPIGPPVREWFFSHCDPGYAWMIRHAHDKVNALIYWFYPARGTSTLNSCIAYNYKSNKWGIADRTIECVAEYITGGYTYETLPFSTYDTWPEIAYDSPFWDASSRYVGYFGTDHKIYTLTGTSSSCSLTTGQYGEESQYSLLIRVTLRYLNRPTTATASNFYSDYLGGAWTTGVTTSEYNGRFDVLQSAPFHKIKFDFTGDCEITAAAADVKPGGVL